MAASKSKPAFPTDQNPPFITQSELEECHRIRQDLQALQADLRWSEKSIRERLRAGATVEPGPFHVVTSRHGKPVVRFGLSRLHLSVAQINAEAILRGEQSGEAAETPRNVNQVSARDEELRTYIALIKANRAGIDLAVNRLEDLADEIE